MPAVSVEFPFCNLKASVTTGSAQLLWPEQRLDAANRAKAPSAEQAYLPCCTQDSNSPVALRRDIRARRSSKFAFCNAVYFSEASIRASAASWMLEVPELIRMLMLSRFDCASRYSNSATCWAAESCSAER